MKRDKLYTDFEEGYMQGYHEGYEEGCEVGARKKGKWVYKLFDENTGISDYCWCSECDYPRSQMSWNFCGNCGAKMEAGE